MVERQAKWEEKRRKAHGGKDRAGGGSHGGQDTSQSMAHGEVMGALAAIPARTCFGYHFVK